MNTEQHPVPPQEVADTRKAGISRRRFLKYGAGVAAASLGLVEMCWETSKEKERISDIEHFRDLSGGVLILCADANEKHRVIQTYIEKNATRVAVSRFNRENLYGGKIVRLTTHVRKFEDRDVQGAILADRLSKIPVLVLSQTDLATPEVQRAIGEETFRFIQLRGHDFQMDELETAARSHYAESTLLAFGGCVGADLIPKYFDKNRPVIADKDIGYTLANTAFSVGIIDQIGVSSSWEDLYRRINEVHGFDTVREGIIMPGQPDYFDYVKKQ